MKTDIAPGLLIATPHLRDPNFDHTVVLMFEHSEEGALGLVINRRLDLLVEQVLSDLSITPGPLGGQPVHYGGPVSMEIGWVIHSTDHEEASTRKVTDDIAVSTSREILEAIAGGNGPSRYMLCLGYAGWGGEQIEGEVGQGAWLTAPATADLVFDLPVSERWKACYERLGIDPFQMSVFVGNA